MCVLLTISILRVLWYDIGAVWSESSLSVWRPFGYLVTPRTPCEDTDRTVRMRRLIWVFTGRLLRSPMIVFSRHPFPGAEDENTHDENTPFQIYWKFHHQKLKVFRQKFWYFSYFSSKHSLWYSFEPSRRGGSNEYSQSMFLSRNKKNNLYPVNPSLNPNLKVGCLGGQNYILGMFSWCIHGAVCPSLFQHRESKIHRVVY